MSSWLAEVAAIFAKEWRCELRTRVALSTVVLFAVTTLFVVSLALGPAGTSPELRPALPVLLWVILLFAASAGLPRAFVQEQETGTADALRLTSSASALFVGKMLYNLALLLALEIVVTPFFLGMLRLPVADPTALVVALVAGGVGLAAGSTLIAAMVSQARLVGPLFAVLAFPVLLPLLKLAVDATFAAVLGEPASMAIRLTLLYDSMLTVAGLMLFPVVWNP